MSGIHKGRHALITGGGTGIGEAIALALAAEGCSVTITGRRMEALEATCAKAKGIHPLVMDVNDEASVVNGTAAAIKARGAVDIHVANAGIAETSAFAKTSLEFWRKVMTTNLDGAFLTCREVVPGMMAGGWGRIITISSIAGLKGLKYGAAYSASKHGLIGLTRVISEEFMHKGITANAICPGSIDTPMLRGAMEKRGRDPQEVAERLSLIGRFGTVDEIAGAALWLCSGAAGFTMGHALAVDGGYLSR